MIANVQREKNANYPLLHKIYMNKNVTLEIIRCLLDDLPDAANKLGRYESTIPTS